MRKIIKNFIQKSHSAEFKSTLKSEWIWFKFRVKRGFYICLIIFLFALLYEYFKAS